jgi:hypothetical protein
VSKSVKFSLAVWGYLAAFMTTMTTESALICDRASPCLKFP